MIGQAQLRRPYCLMRRCLTIASLLGGVRRPGRYEPWRSHGSLRGRAPGTCLCAGAGSYPPRRPATEAASSVDPLLSRHSREFAADAQAGRAEDGSRPVAG